MPEVYWNNSVIINQYQTTWEILAKEAEEKYAHFFENIPKYRTVWVVNNKDAFRVVALLLQTRKDGGFITEERFNKKLEELLVSNNFAIIINGDIIIPTEEGIPIVPGRILLLTSGTTGLPKLVNHTWASLFTSSKLHSLKPHRWLLPYHPGTYAWYQIVTMSLFLPKQDIVSADPTNLKTFFDIAYKNNVNAMSTTPTFWHLAFLQVGIERLKKISFQQLTLGGEKVDQELLDKLKKLYPQAKITHIYAQTEAGAAIVVNDGKAGFPVSWLDRNKKREVEVKIENGHLLIRSPYTTNAAEGKADQWIDTGDLVEKREDRIYFVGRADTRHINVGGMKAYPADVESIIYKYPGVAWCRVWATKAPLVGELPVADVVPELKYKNSLTEDNLIQHCKKYLPEHAVPRIWNFLEDIPISSTYKSEMVKK